MYSGLMLDDIIVNLFSDITLKTKDWAKKYSFYKIQVDKIYLYRESLQDHVWKKWIADTKKTLRTHHFIEKEKLRKFLCGLLYIVIDEAYLENRINQFINDISNFSNEHIIKCYSNTKSNIYE